MRSVLLTVAIIAAVARGGFAQSPAAPYQRMRTGAEAMSARGSFPPAWNGGGWGWGGGFYPPYFAQPIVTGSWYQRPYPHHFDYYRYRWGGGQSGASGNGGSYGDPGVEMMPAADCPCLNVAPDVTPSEPL